MTSAYPAPLAALPSPIGGGGEADINNFNNFNNDDKTKEVELVATDNDVVILRNVRRRSDACAQRCLAYHIACTLLPLSHVR